MPEEAVDIPDFTQSEKSKLLELTVQSPLYAVKYIKDNYNLSLRDAKYVVTHINEIYGHCNRCSFDELDKEYMACPECGALNFNWGT